MTTVSALMTDAVVSEAEWSAYVDAFVAADEPASAVDLSTSPMSVVVDACLSAVDGSVTTVLTALDAGAASMAAGEVLDALRRVEVLRRRLPAIEHRLIAQMEQRAIAADYAQASTQKLLATQLTIGPAEASARVRAASSLGPRVALDGQVLAPRLELVAEAQQAGHVSERHVHVIGQAMRLLPPSLDATARGEIECTLVGHAVDLDSQQLARVAARVLDQVDPDGREPAVEKARRLRDLRLYARAEGSYRISGDLTPECGATWQPILDSLSKPVPETEGVKDERTAGQRRHDGLLAAGQRLLRSDTLPDSGGVPATIVVRVDADDLATRQGYGTTGHGVDWPMADLLDTIGDRASWTTVFGSPADGILAYGLDRRYATRAQTLVDRPRRRVLFPRLRHPGGVVRTPPHHPGRAETPGRRARPHRPGQPVPAVHLPPRPLRTRRMAVPDARRPTVVATTGAPRPAPNTQTQHPLGPATTSRNAAWLICQPPRGQHQS